MSHPINRLVYVSRATADAASSFEAVVAEVVGVSQRNNARVGVTGLLMATGGWFLQALEGPRPEISAAFARIVQDPRHEVLELIQAGPVDGRLFGRWSMCAPSITPQAAPLLEVMLRPGGLDPRSLDPAGALRLLMTVASVADGALERVAVGGR